MLNPPEVGLPEAFGRSSAFGWRRLCRLFPLGPRPTKTTRTARSGNPNTEAIGVRLSAVAQSLIDAGLEESGSDRSGSDRSERLDGFTAEQDYGEFDEDEHRWEPTQTDQANYNMYNTTEAESAGEAADAGEDDDDD